MIWGLLIAIIITLSTELYFLITFRKNGIALFLGIPIILFTIIYAHMTYQNILGYPTHDVLEVNKDSYRLVAFHVVPKTDIYLWLLKRGEKTPRAHRIPYSKKMRKKLNGVRKKLKKGDIMLIKKLKKDEESLSKFIIYNLPFPKWLNKD